MKKLDFLKIVIGLFFGLVIFSCNKDDASVILTEQLEKQEVVFDINDFMPNTLSSKGLFSAKDNGDSPNDETVPNCLDLEPSFVDIRIIGPDQIPTTYMLKLVTLANKTETEVLKLTPGIYTITDFVVRAADGTLLWASPREGSYYEQLWDLTGVDLVFEVPVFDKLRVEIDVLCYRPYDYERFGFVWFKYAVTEIHTVCFYGDICTKFFNEWHEMGRENPYYLQDFDGYDFPAIFSVVVKNSEGVVVNDLELNSNAAYWGIGQPLCIEYPDQVEIDNEIFDFEIWLAMPNGSNVLLYEGQFNDTAMAEIGNPEAFGGTDGIFDFVVGNCSYDGNDATLELLPWMPIPDNAQMDIMGAPGEDYLILAKFRDGTVMPNPIPNVIEEEVWYNTLCGEEFVEIYEGGYYVEFYSSLDRNLPNTNFPLQYMDYPWGSINYLANHCEENVALYGWDYIQEALWYIIGEAIGVPSARGVNNQLAQDAMANPGFIPTVGDYACVLIESLYSLDDNTPNKNANAAKTEALNGFQLLLMRVDP